MKVTLTQLRADLYKIVDQLIETGVPVEIERKGHKIQIVSVESEDKLKNLKAHPGTIIGNPEDFIHMDWSSEWKEEDSI